MESDRNDGAAVGFWEPVVVVPPVLAVLVGVAVGADAGEFFEVELAGFGEVPDADGSVTGVERDRLVVAVGEDGLVLEVGVFWDPSTRLPAGLVVECDLDAHGTRRDGTRSGWRQRGKELLQLQDEAVGGVDLCSMLVGLSIVEPHV